MLLLKAFDFVKYSNEPMKLIFLPILYIHTRFYFLDIFFHYIRKRNQSKFDFDILPN